MSDSDIDVSLYIGSDNLECVTLFYICENCGTEMRVKPTFFEEAGVPMCGNMECDKEGDDMTINGVGVTHYFQ